MFRWRDPEWRRYWWRNGENHHLQVLLQGICLLHREKQRQVRHSDSLINKISNIVLYVFTLSQSLRWSYRYVLAVERLTTEPLDKVLYTYRRGNRYWTFSSLFSAMSIEFSVYFKISTDFCCTSCKHYFFIHPLPLSKWFYRIQMLPGVLLKELSISVSSNDDSYMPKSLAVLVGNREGALKEIKTPTIPRYCVHV